LKIDLRILGLFFVVLGILSLVCSYFVPFYRFLPAWKHWDGFYTVGSGTSNGPLVELSYGPVAEGMLEISGGNNDIYFSVEDSQGGTVIPKTLASGEYYFGPFQALQNTYYFKFDNSVSLLTPKTVYWIVRAYWYNLVFLIFGVSSLALGIFVTWYERRKKPKPETEIERLLERVDSNLKSRTKGRKEKEKS
jgi:hypothetical protein